MFIQKKRGGIQWLLNYALSSKDIFDVRNFVLEVDNKIIGHIAYIKDVRCFEGGIYELCALVVDKSHQGKDYGKQLIRHTETELKKINARIAWMQTGEKNKIDYYKKLGYKLIAEWKNYWGINKHRYVMSRSL